MLYSVAIVGALATSYVLTQLFPGCNSAINWGVIIMTIIIVLILTYYYFVANQQPPIQTTPTTGGSSSTTPDELRAFFNSDPINTWRSSDPVAFDHCLRLIAAPLTDDKKEELMDTFTAFSFKPAFQAYADQLNRLLR